jgi:hypothetical protein
MARTALPGLAGLVNISQLPCATQFTDDHRQAQRPHFPLLSGGALFHNLDASDGWLSILRFEHKLWNALALTTRDPRLYMFIGVKWVTPMVLKVNRDVFGRFINVTRPAAALYNNQGSFMTHGFVEVPLKNVTTISAEDAFDVDESIVRLFRHGTDSFTMRSDREHVMTCCYGRH